MELLGRPIRVSEIDPGMVETEFSLVRFDGDTDRAAAVYAGVGSRRCRRQSRSASAFIGICPSHVDVDQLSSDRVTRARLGLVHRRS